MIAVGSNGGIQIYSTAATDLVIDVQGYFVSGNGGTTAPGGFVPLPQATIFTGIGC